MVRETTIDVQPYLHKSPKFTECPILESCDNADIWLEINIFYVGIIRGYGTLPKHEQQLGLHLVSDQLLPSQTNEFWERISATINPEMIKMKHENKGQFKQHA